MKYNTAFFLLSLLINTTTDTSEPKEPIINELNLQASSITDIEKTESTPTKNINLKKIFKRIGIALLGVYIIRKIIIYIILNYLKKKINNLGINNINKDTITTAAETVKELFKNPEQDNKAIFKEILSLDHGRINRSVEFLSEWIDIQYDTLLNKLKEEVRKQKENIKNSIINFLTTEIITLTIQAQKREIKIRDKFPNISFNLPSNLHNETSFSNISLAGQIDIMTAVMQIYHHYIAPDLNELTFNFDKLAVNINDTLLQNIKHLLVLISQENSMDNYQESTWKKIIKKEEGDENSFFEKPYESIAAEYRQTLEAADWIKDLKLNMMVNNSNYHCLFYGPPGTGKTTLVKHIIKKILPNNDNQIYYRQITPSDIRGTYINESSQRIDKLELDIKAFYNSLENKNNVFLVLHIDECESVFPARLEVTQHSVNTTNDINTCTNSFITFFDRSKDITEYKIVFMLTTNHKKNIDAAILRSGRVSRHLELKNLKSEEAEECAVWYIDKMTKDSNLLQEEIETLKIQFKKTPLKTPAAIEATVTNNILKIIFSKYNQKNIPDVMG